MVPFFLPFSLLAACAMDAGMAEDRTDSGGYAPQDGDDDTADGTDTAPEETEDDYMKLAPAATVEYVFVANPGRDTITRIEVATLAVLTTEVGHIPAIVTTTPDHNHAVTLNEGDDSVSVVDARTLEVSTVGIRDNMNRMELSDDGLWAMCWYDPDADSLGETGGAISFNEASFVNLDTLAHSPMAVGFSPHGVDWTEDGQRAVVLSDHYLAVVDLTAATLSPRLITLGDDDAPNAAEVALSPDGTTAFVRQTGADDILVVDLDTGDVTPVVTGAGVSDLDLSPDGREITIVARTARHIVRLDVSDPFATPVTVDFPTDTAYGSLLYVGDGERALLYTNAALVPAYAIWTVASGDVEERDLVKPVQNIGVSASGDSLIVFHTREDAEGASPSDPFYNEWAVTMTSLSSGIQNPILLPAESTEYAVADDGSFGFLIMDKLGYLEALNYGTLLNDEVELPSGAVHVGVLPDRNLAYVSQEHDLGRLSFYDPETTQLDTITGFELNAEIDHE